MNTLPQRTWVTEFGSKYEVPPQILQSPHLHDCSWHNDAGPSFSIHEVGDRDIDDITCVWIFHPDPEKRLEWDDMPRFMITKGSEEVLSTADIGEVMGYVNQAVYDEVNPNHYAWQSRQAGCITGYHETREKCVAAVEKQAQGTLCFSETPEKWGGFSPISWLRDHS